MSIASRQNLWKSTSITAKNYVKSGLIALWDGIENAGWGVHNASATTWKDLVGSYNLINNGCTVTQNSTHHLQY